MALKATSAVLAAALALACSGAAIASGERDPAGEATVCRHTGCGGQVCAAEDRMSTCEWRPEHDCYRAARCERQPDGACGFTPDPELERCLARAREGGQGKRAVPVE